METKNILEITTKDLLELVNILFDIPNRLTMRKEFKNKNLDFILDYSSNIDSISIGTINKYIVTINKFFKYCNKLNYTENLLKIDKVTNKSLEQTRIGYEEEDLKLIFDKLNSIDYEKSLIIRIALFSGLRLGEIVQLTKKDIKFDTKTEIYYFDINTENGKKVKNKSSIRIVPIHSSISSEIQTYISMITDNLFSISSEEFSKWFGAKFNRAYITQDKRKVFHSFRHNAITNMVQNNVPLEDVASVVGHKQELEMTFHYAGNTMPLKKLRQAISSINYKIKFYSTVKP
jgi:integrase